MTNAIKSLHRTYARKSSPAMEAAVCPDGQLRTDSWSKFCESTQPPPPQEQQEQKSSEQENKNMNAKHVLHHVRTIIAASTATDRRQANRAKSEEGWVVGGIGGTSQAGT